MSTQDQTLDTCGCCEGITELTPQNVDNVPGLSALAYRVGTHGSFKTTMLATLTGPGGVGKLTTRYDYDPSIALLDACATMLDVLTFYQERIANEGFLRTATERFSVLELARAIGYELNPGVGASTYLAFTLETGTGAPGEATIPIGTKVQSVPGQDEKPQTFETVEAIAARAVWNVVKPQLQIALPGFDDKALYLQGTTTNLKVGDALLVAGDERRNNPGNENWDFRRVLAVAIVTPSDGNTAYTIVTLDRSLGSAIPLVHPASQNPTVYALRLRANFFGYNAPDWRAMSNIVKAGYLGLADDSPDIALYTEWPGLTLDHIASGTGLSGDYYDNANLTDLKLTRIDPTINFDWGRGRPAPEIGVDTFSIRWTGFVEPKVSGAHTFYTLSDDGVRLWVNNQLIVDNWTVHPSTENSGTITMQAGQKYPIRLEFFQQSGVAVIKLSWSAPGVDKEIVPASQLYPTVLADIYLDAVYSQLVAGGWVVLSIPEYQELYQIVTATESARADFTLSAKTTRLNLQGEQLAKIFNTRVRDTTIFAQSEELPLATRPVQDPVEGDHIVLDQLLLGLEEKRTVIFSGKRMRAQVAANIQDPAQLVLTAPGHPPAALASGDVLQIVQDPVILADGRTQWTLTDKNGFTGTVTVGNDYLFLIAADISQLVALAPGASLLVMGPPLAQPDGLEVWTLTDKNDFTGTLRVAPTKREQIFALIPSEKDDSVVSEVAIIKTVPPNRDPTEIVLTAPLAYIYDRPTVAIYANVARATHGETRNEVLGSGDAAQPFQDFTLRQKPLTYVSAPTASGAASTLAVRVNDVLWKEAPSLYTLNTRDRAYITRRADDGTVTVQFGDGVHGARVPSGDENVTAVYRTAIGTEGLVKAGQLSLLISRPLGVQKVTNPLAPTGAADPEPLAEARQNAPFTVLTLDRIVSIKDCEDFARAFAGIGKAQAIWLWNGAQRLVHLTIAAAASSNGLDFSVDASSDLFKHLRLAIDGARDPVQPLVIASYEPLLFNVEARILVDPVYVAEKVLAAVTTALRDAYAFTVRNFGQPVHSSEVQAIMQRVAGVQAVFLQHLYVKGKVPDLVTPLPARGAILENETLKPAQLLLINANGITLTEVQS